MSQHLDGHELCDHPVYCSHLDGPRKPAENSYIAAVDMAAPEGDATFFKRQVMGFFPDDHDPVMLADYDRKPTQVLGYDGVVYQYDNVIRSNPKPLTPQVMQEAIDRGYDVLDADPAKRYVRINGKMVGFGDRVDVAMMRGTDMHFPHCRVLKIAGDGNCIIVEDVKEDPEHGHRRYRIDRAEWKGHVRPMGTRIPIECGVKDCRWCGKNTDMSHDTVRCHPRDRRVKVNGFYVMAGHELWFTTRQVGGVSRVFKCTVREIDHNGNRLTLTPMPPHRPGVPEAFYAHRRSWEGHVRFEGPIATTPQVCPVADKCNHCRPHIQSPDFAQLEVRTLALAAERKRGSIQVTGRNSFEQLAAAVPELHKLATMYGPAFIHDEVLLTAEGPKVPMGLEQYLKLMDDAYDSPEAKTAREIVASWPKPEKVELFATLKDGTKNTIKPFTREQVEGVVKATEAFHSSQQMKDLEEYMTAANAESRETPIDWKVKKPWEGKVVVARIPPPLPPIESPVFSRRVSLKPPHLPPQHERMPESWREEAAPAQLLMAWEAERNAGVPEVTYGGGYMKEINGEMEWVELPGAKKTKSRV